MRISTAIVSTLVAAGSLSLSVQYSIGQQQAMPTLALPDLQTDPLALPEATAAQPQDAAPNESAPAGTETAATDATAPASPEQSATTGGNTTSGNDGAAETVAPTAEPTSAGSTTSSADSTAAPSAEPTATATAEPTATQEPAPTAEPTVATPVVQTLVSDPIEYKYGVVQLSIETTDGKITSVKLLQGDASYGRDVAYEALIQATIAVQGTNYGNVSGATFTTDAFKKAVTNALAKR